MGDYDRFSKEFLRRILEPWGVAQAGATLGTDAQEADVLFAPDLAKRDRERERERERELGLLGRIASTSCLIENFHNTPGRDAILECVRKQLTLHHRNVSERAVQHWAVPDLWVLSSGRPEGALTGLGFARLAGWPEGVYSNGLIDQPAWIVVIRELPPVPQTLLVRLLGAGPVLRDAIDELRIQGETTRVRAIAQDLIGWLHAEQDHLGVDRLSREDQEWRTMTEHEFEAYKQKLVHEAKLEGEARGMLEGEARGKLEGEARGKLEGKAESLLAVLSARGLVVTPEQRMSILSCRDLTELDALLKRAISVSSTEELMH